MSNPIYNGFFLPNRSSIGPYTNCPTDIPIKKEDKEREICATVVFRSAAIAGNPGKYMSIEKGPIADKLPSIKIKKNFRLPFIIRSR